MARILLALVALGVAACGGSSATPADAPVQQDLGDEPQADAAVTSDGGLLVADFVAQGCERLEEWSLDGGAARDDGGGRGGTVCIGHAPLTLTFVPVASQNVESYVWTFGEPNETPLREDSPTHTFVLPGSFDVTLTVGGPAGTLTVKHVPPFVQVLANPAGWPCDRAEQCESDHQCACPRAAETDTSCPAAFGGRGLCTRVCDQDTPCGVGAACADVGLSAAWRPQLCVATCDAATTCPAGLSCRDLPAADGTGAWVSACFPGFLGAVGVPCLDADGQPEPWTCLGGVCLELGSFGYCSAACEIGGCPAGSECARVGGAGGHSVCLASCETTSCSDDPLLGCEAPDAAGTLGFELVASTPPAGATYCAPRRCATPADCAGLRCADLGGASFCQPNP
jgi:hypothetical protein